MFFRYSVIQRLQRRFQDIMGAADIDDHAVVGQRLAEEGHVDDECRPVQLLRQPENLAAKAVGDHDMVPHLDGEHALFP